MKVFFTGLSVLTLTVFVLFSQVTLAEEAKATFSEEELDQMMAPIALYPDSLLAQILMASTYPSDVAEAAKWSKANPKQEGDAAVKAVQEKSWDPSVMSLVAFPQVLEMMGEKPDWVQDVGDAFLADSETVMNTTQKLRKKAKEAGNLETSEQQKVTEEDSSTNQTVIIIEPSNPEVVYVPVYNPTVIYGVWWWPHYTPYYYHPVGYGFTAGVMTGIGWGIGIGITNSLWGGCNWGHGDIDIDINRHNEINIDKNRLDKNNRKFEHNGNNRRGVPYKDSNSRKKHDRKRAGADQRKDFRGRDAQRDKARATLGKHGIDPAKERKQLTGAGGDRARKSVNMADRQVSSGRLQNRDAGRSSLSTRSRDSALRSAGNSNRSRQSFSRGTSSHRSMGQSRSGGGMRGGGLRGGGRR